MSTSGSPATWAAVMTVLLAACFALGAERKTIRLECTADTAIHIKKAPSSADIYKINYGAAKEVAFHGIHYTKEAKDSAFYFLADFDTSKVRGRELTGGVLMIRQAASPDADKLRVVSVSTISTPWKEGTGTGTKPARPGGGAMANWADFGRRRWAGFQSELTDVTFDLGNSISHTATVRHLEGNWVAIELPAPIVQALVNGGTYGLALFEEKGQTKIPYRLHTRESGHGPYLLVDSAGKATGRPTAPTFSVRPAPAHASPTAGAVKVSVSVPKDLARAEVSYRRRGSTKPNTLLPLWQIPRPPKGGGKMSLVITDLPPRGDVTVAVRSIGASGLASTTTETDGRASAALAVPVVPDVAIKANPKGSPTIRTGKVRLWAYGDCESAHPVTGNLLEEVGLKQYGAKPAGEYRKGNIYWNGRDGVVTLAGCRNEIVAFQLLIEAVETPVADIGITAGSLSGPGGAKVPASNISVFRQWYIRDGEWMGDLCVPLGPGTTFAIPNADNKVPSQRNQSLLVDIRIPKDAAPGRYRGTITVAIKGAEPFDVPVSLEVRSPVLPDTLSFNCELNAYSSRPLTGDYAWFRLAHAHRTTLNVLPYSQDGSAKTRYAIPLQGKGAEMRVADWSGYDAYFGPLLDGSAFADMPRAGMPLASQYLPFCEAWPINFRDHYAFKSTDLQKHFLTAGPIEELMDEEYGRGFRAVTADFMRHFEKKGWTRTEMQFYLNNKPTWTKGKLGFWCLDEPQNRDDWLAIAYWGRLFKQAVAGAEGGRFIYRGDISRPHRQRRWLDGVVDLMCVSKTFYTKHERCAEMMGRGMTFYNYGSLNPIRASNLNAEAWPVSAYLLGADGLLPWNTIGSPANHRRASTTAILVPPPPGGPKGQVVCSVRLKALRRGQQDVEYLALLARKRGYDRRQLGAMLKGLLELKGQTQERFLDEAGETIFHNLSSEQFARVRAAVAAMLAEE